MERFLNTNKQCGSEEKHGEPKTIGEVVKKQKYRKYDDSYLNFGFTSIDVNHWECRQCVLCPKVLAPKCMIPGRLEHH